jgi:hypothetical protein
LFLRGNPLGERGVEVLALALKPLGSKRKPHTNLNKLDLSYCQLGISGLLHVIEALK